MKVKEFRNKKGYTQLQVAEMLGISLNSYRNKERGLREFKVKELIRLEQVLSARISEMFII